MKLPNKYWVEADLRDMKKAKNFGELSDIAFRVIQRMPLPIGEVCGPITSGGLGSREKNLEVFERVINQLRCQEKNIFDQLPFEAKLYKFTKAKWFMGGLQLLTEFYLPLFRSGRIQTFYFMHNWKTSLGACWEHEKAEELGIRIVYL